MSTFLVAINSAWINENNVKPSTKCCTLCIEKSNKECDVMTNYRTQQIAKCKWSSSSQCMGKFSFLQPRAHPQTSRNNYLFHIFRYLSSTCVLFQTLHRLAIRLSHTPKTKSTFTTRSSVRVMHENPRRQIDDVLCRYFSSSRRLLHQYHR